MRTAVAAGCDVCFANPGTTEMPLVMALDKEVGVRAILGLFEGVCTGAADGYGRMTGRPALTLLHLGPGFANGIANLHNARRARSPVVNVVGDHASWHRSADAPLTSDIDSLARPVSAWVGESESSEGLAAAFATAHAEAIAAPGHVATLIAPADHQWGPAGRTAATAPARPAPGAEPERIERAAARLRESRRPTLFLGAHALQRRGLLAAGRVAAATGAALLCETFPSRVERGGDLPRVERLPYFPEMVQARLADVDTLVRAGAPEPVSFFGYEGVPSRLASDASLCLLAEPHEDATAALEDLADALSAPPSAPPPAPAARPERPTGPLDPSSLGAALVAAQPEGAIVMDEAATSGLPWFVASETAVPHTYLALTGGAIGQGLPCATGAAVACPDRKVIAFQADGSGLYTLQALWTQAREGLDVTTIVCANRAYRILQVELGRAGIAEPGAKARALTDLGHPAIDWVALARGLGVPGIRVETTDALNDALGRAFAEAGPQLIEVLL